MLYSRLPGKTDKVQSASMKSFPGYGYLLKAGYIRAVGKGLHSLLPLGKKVENNLKELLVEEMEELGGMEISVPLVSPASLWKKSGRLDNSQTPFITFKDRGGRNLLLSPTHEESVTELVKGCVQSHKDLPLFVYQFQLKFRDELRPRGGLLRTKEFMMKDGYSFHRSFVELNNFFPVVFKAYQRIFEKCQVKCFPVEADPGFMQGSRSYEFIMPHPKGKSVSLFCDSCNYRASQSIAQGERSFVSETLEPLVSKEAKDFTTIHALQKQWDIPLSRFCVCQLYRCTHGLFMTIHRADHELSTVKLKALIGNCKALPPEEEDFSHIGQVPRFLSPFGLPDDVRILVDESVVESPNLIMPSPDLNIFYINVNFGRDFDANRVGDFVKTQSGEICSICGGLLKETPGMELGHIFKLDDYYSRKLDFTYQNLRGEQVYPHMGSYGIGIGRLLEAIAESNHDERGLLWPYRLAPFKFFLMGTGKSPTIKEFVNNLEKKLGKDVLLDDRVENIGTKFKDFELLGIPLKIVVGNRFLQQGTVELYDRKKDLSWDVSADDLLDVLEEWKQGEHY